MRARVYPDAVRRPGVLAAVAALAFLSGCAGDPDPVPSHGPIATFEVAGGETFKVELATPELVDHAERLLEGEDVSSIPLGTVVRGDPGPNEPWSWHLDPATFQFAFQTTEVCDGIPSEVEDGTVTSPDYCPWSASIVSID